MQGARFFSKFYDRAGKIGAGGHSRTGGEISKEKGQPIVTVPAELFVYTFSLGLLACGVGQEF